MRYLLVKAKVRAHTRRTPQGGTAQVREYEDKRGEAALPHASILNPTRWFRERTEGKTLSGADWKQLAKDAAKLERQYGAYAREHGESHKKKGMELAAGWRRVAEAARDGAKSASPTKRPSASERTLAPLRRKMAQGLNEANRAKFEAMSRAKQNAVVLRAIDKGLVKWTIGGG